MGRATKWFRSLLSSKKPPADPSSSAADPPAKEKKNKKNWWGFSKSAENSSRFKNGDVEGLDANKHAIAVAAATAAVAEAALAAARAAAEVVRLTSSGGGSGRTAPAEYVSRDRRRVVAATKIQSAFRAYLARRALRALKGLVKLQALVRGRIVRKQSADMLRRMQAMARVQAQASARRIYASQSASPNIKFSNSPRPSVANPRTYDVRPDNAKPGGSNLKQYNSKHRVSNSVGKGSELRSFLDQWMEQRTQSDAHNTSLDPDWTGDDRSDKILEIDTWKPRQKTRSNNNKSSLTSQYFSAWNYPGWDHSKTSSPSTLSSKLQKPSPSISSEEVSSVISSKFPLERDAVATWTAEISPNKVHSASSRRTSNLRGPFTPTRSECSRSLFGDYLAHPNYMANTESSRAKVRSQSAPKQRMQLEELGRSMNFGRGLWEPDTISDAGSTRPTNFRSYGYGNQGRLQRQGTPTRGAATGPRF